MLGKIRLGVALAALLATSALAGSLGFTVTIEFQPPIPAPLLAEILSLSAPEVLAGLAVGGMTLIGQRELSLDLGPILAGEAWRGALILTADPAPGGEVAIRLIQSTPQPQRGTPTVVPQALVLLEYGPPGLKVRLETAGLPGPGARLVVRDPAQPGWIEPCQGRDCSDLPCPSTVFNPDCGTDCYLLSCSSYTVGRECVSGYEGSWCWRLTCQQVGVYDCPGSCGDVTTYELQWIEGGPCSP